MSLDVSSKKVSSKPLDFQSLSSIDKIDAWTNIDDSETLKTILIDSNKKIETRDPIEIMKSSSFFVIKLLKKFGEHNALKYNEKLITINDDNWSLDYDDDYFDVYLYELPHSGNNPFHHIKILHPVTKEWVGVINLFLKKDRLADKIYNIYYFAVDFLSKVVIRYYNEGKFAEGTGYMNVIENEHRRIVMENKNYVKELNFKHINVSEQKEKEPSVKVSTVNEV